MSRTAPGIILDEVQREQLQALIRASSAGQAQVLRARIVLLAASNGSSQQIAEQLNTTQQTVCKWRRRFARHGLKGLRDALRSGRPARVSAKILNTVLTKVTQPPKGRARWSCRSMAKQAGVSKSWVQQLWFRNDLKPHQTRTFKLSNDRQFEQKFVAQSGGALFPRPESGRCATRQFRQRAGTQRSDLWLSRRTQLGAQALRLESNRRGNPGEDKTSARALERHN